MSGFQFPPCGNMIAWYAFGVVIGAPIMALLSSRFSLKSVMLFLAALCILGNTLFTFSSSYAMLALSGWFPGFPTGRSLASARLSCRKSRRQGR